MLSSKDCEILKGLSLENRQRLVENYDKMMTYFCKSIASIQKDAASGKAVEKVLVKNKDKIAEMVEEYNQMNEIAETGVVIDEDTIYQRISDEIQKNNEELKKIHDRGR